jgi:hypothetical protein
MPLDREVLDTFLARKKTAEVRDRLLHSSDPAERLIGSYIADNFHLRRKPPSKVLLMDHS